jgi:hypothetical protein
MPLAGERSAMKVTKQVCLGSLLFCLVSPLSATEARQGLSVFAGTWRCLDEVGGHTLKSRLSIRASGERLWRVEYVQEQNPQLDKPYRSEGVWGYDPFQKRFFRYVFDNFSGSDLGFSDGLSGHSFVWTGEAEFFGEKLEYVGTFRLRDPSHYESRYQSRKSGAPSEPWQETVRSECRKQS